MTDSHSTDQALIDAMLRETDPTRQNKLIEELGIRRATAAVEPLIQQVLLNTFQSGAAITALGRIGDRRAVDTLIQSCRHQNLAWVAKDALVEIGTPAVEPLIEVLNHDNPDIRFMAVRVLGELADPRAVEPLETMIETEPDETNRQLARSTLKNLLFDSLESPDPHVRQQAVYSVDRLGDARMIEPLQVLADHDPDEAIRQAAQTAILHLLQTVENDPFADHHLPLRSRDTNLSINRLVRAARLQMDAAADLSGETRTFAVLQEASTHPDPAICELAQRALWQLCIDYLRQPRAEIRLLAVQGLRWFAGSTAARLLRQIADHDPDDAVRRAARAAVRP
jgi:HEAT repeat protein